LIVNKKKEAAATVTQTEIVWFTAFLLTYLLLVQKDKSAALETGLEMGVRNQGITYIDDLVLAEVIETAEKP
jgi:hypothetical protein